MDVGEDRLPINWIYYIVRIGEPGDYLAPTSAEYEAFIDS